jgi:hypothetical protein
MKTRDTQGSFIILIWTLIAKVKEVTSAPVVSIHPRADLVADLLLRPLIFRCMQRRQAEETRLSQRVFRYCSSCPSPSYTSSFY